MTTFTSRNVPLVEGTDPADIAARVNPVAQLQHDRPGVSTLTTTQRNALTGAELWDGRLILNTTTDRLNRYDLGTTSWIVIPDTGDIAGLLATTGTPAALGTTADRGVGTSAAHSDHVHAWPTWQSYTPTLAGGTTVGTGGSAGITGLWVQMGKTIHFWARATLGTTGVSVAGGFQFSLPVNRAAAGHGTVFFNDVSANFYVGALNWGSAQVACFVPGTNGAGVTITATSPFTWAAGDYAEVAGTYQSV